MNLVDLDWPTIITAFTSVLGGGGIVLFLAKTLISRSLKQQDVHEQALRKIGEMLADLKIDIAVIKRDISHALELRTEVKADHDKLVVLEVKTDKNKDDINHAWMQLRSRR